MRKTLMHIMLFLLPIALLAGGMEIFLRIQPNSYSAKQAAIDRMAPSVETLILGASHNYMGINPALLHSCALNLANVSQTPNIDIRLLKACLPKMPKLRTVVTGTDNAIFFDAPLQEGGESFRCTYYNLYMDLERIGAWPEWGFEMSHWDGAQERLKQTLLGSGFAVCDSLGWYPEYKLEKREEGALSDEMGRRRNDNNTCRNWDFPKRNRELLLELTRLCQANGIRLIVLRTPVSAVYRRYTPKRQAEAVEQMLNECRRSEGVTVADYAADKRFDDNDFFDTDHLTANGAEKFSKILSAELGI